MRASQTSVPERYLPGALAANLLNLILMPTEQCNFRCTYCYEDFALGRMPPKVVRGIKRFIARRAPSLDRLDLSWFGGEPLLAVDIVEDVQAHAAALAARFRRLRVSASMTTNGYLLTPMRLGRLLELGVRNYQISFDGPPEFHDRKRVRAGGQATFERIWGNLLAARTLRAEFRILVRTHVDRENQEAISEFVELYKDAFGDDRRFDLFLRPLSRLGGANDALLAVLGDEEGSRVVGAARQSARAAGLSVYVPGEDHALCYAAAANSFVVRADGTLAKCTVALSHPQNRVGRLLEDGCLELDEEKMQGWIRGLWSGQTGELRCPMVGFADARPVPAPSLLAIGV